MRTWILLVLLCAQQPLSAYSFQTHEQLIDLSWNSTIKPFILSRYPHTTAEDLERAHAYAYGGCAIQDLGYYPGGNHFFSDLTHYVRTGEFIESLFRQARNSDELAFAIGALSHYVGDAIGHRLAINPSVAIEFPKLEKRYGSTVNYAQSPHAHVQTEFAFDIDEISKRRMAPAAYLRHVGLKVATGSLGRAFLETYGLHFERVLGQRRPVVRGYRFAVRSFLPRIAYGEALLHRKKFPPDDRTPAFEIFERNLESADFEKYWEPYRRQTPTFLTRVVAATIFIMPKFGPLALLKIRGPIPETHERYIDSVNASTTSLRKVLATKERYPYVPNLDLDTGEKVRPGGYPLTDETYFKLLVRVTKDPTSALPIGLKQNILDYYADPAAPISTKKVKKDWAQVESQLAVLQRMKTSGVAREVRAEAPEPPKDNDP